VFRRLPGYSTQPYGLFLCSATLPDPAEDCGRTSTIYTSALENGVKSGHATAAPAVHAPISPAIRAPPQPKHKRKLKPQAAGRQPTSHRLDTRGRESIMFTMRLGVLLSSILAAVCLAGQPEASTQAAAGTDSANLHQRAVNLSSPAPHFAARLSSPFDTTRAHDTLPGRLRILNPLLVRFLPDAGHMAVTCGQWHSARYLRGAANDDSFYRNPSLNPHLLNEYYPYDSKEMRTIGEVAGWLTPLLVSIDDQQALMPGRYDPPPGRHGWPYRQW